MGFHTKNDFIPRFKTLGFQSAIFVKIGDERMIVTHIILGLIFTFIIWKLLKVTFKVVLWLFLIGLVVAVFSPGHLFLLGGIGFLVLIVLGGLLVLSIISLIFFESD
jgi:hypothetical protein